MQRIFSLPVLAVVIALLFIVGCTSKRRQPPPTDIAVAPEEIHKKIPEIIKEQLDFAQDQGGNIGDSILLFNTALVSRLYESNQYGTYWSRQENWIPLADSVIRFIDSAKLYGLFPEDYHAFEIQKIVRRFRYDTLANSFRRNAVTWSSADLMLTDAFLHLVKDIKLGRLPDDSVSGRKDTALTDAFYEQHWQALQQGKPVTEIMNSLEPVHTGYQQIKAGIRQFLDSADNRDFTVVPSPKTDSAGYKRALQKRLFEGGWISFDSIPADSIQLAQAVKRFQQKNNITVDGKAGEGTIRLLNTSDRQRFVQIAVSMDRYKLLPARLPEKYIWVNLPSFQLRLYDGDSVMLMSKIICGKPITRTPLLTSGISEVITYPQWTVPNSIIVKEILPAVKRNPGYLAGKGFSLVDKDGNEVDPYTVDWSKYSKGIPYKVVQGSGDANALGVLKFNFPNKYAVYLHDTNQRSLFSAVVRSFSHGCVRVKEWEALANYLIRNDALDDMRDPDADTASVPMLDSMNTWLLRKEKHSIPFKKRVPLFIRYFTCEGRNGKLVFYDDIYGEDRKLSQLYFKGK